jgi:hypothetical protein
VELELTGSFNDLLLKTAAVKIKRAGLDRE